MYVDPAWWLERWRLTLENPYTAIDDSGHQTVAAVLTAGGIPVITPEPVALSCVTSQCARSSGLLVRSYCSDGGFRHHGISDTRTTAGGLLWARDTGCGNYYLIGACEPFMAMSPYKLLYYFNYSDQL